MLQRTRLEAEMSEKVGEVEQAIEIVPEGAGG